MIFYIILLLIILAIVIWGGVTQWRFISKDQERYSISDFSQVKGNFYVDLFGTEADNAWATPQIKRTLLWMFATTCLLKCTYILSPNFKNQNIINFLKKYGKIIYLNSLDEIQKLIDSNSNNYLFFVAAQRYGQKYDTDVEPRGNYIYLPHGFDNCFWKNTEISPQHRMIEGLGKLGDKHRYYFYRYNDYDKKLYNILLSKDIEDYSSALDNSIWPKNKPILGILINMSEFTQFLEEHVDQFKELSKKYQIIVRPYPSMIIKKNNKFNYIVDNNVTGIPLLQKSNIIISLGLTSLLDSYLLSFEKCTPLLLIYDKEHYYSKNHKALMNTNRVINPRCCIIQVEGEENILKGIDGALKMDKKEVWKNRVKYINEYFYPQRSDANKYHLKNILNYFNIEG
tara:strand:- start:247 stop:1440 length:1194 start_codon:yes stop_codon:yes gene_type:complete